VSDLTAKEQMNARAAIAFLRARCGGMKPLDKVLRAHKSTLNRPASASLAVRAARLVSVGVDDVLTGKLPPEGRCSHCGHCAQL
jgi:hypothetical protein